MQERWFKMPTGAGNNPILAIIADRLEFPKSMILCVYMMACELSQNNQKKYAPEIIAHSLGVNINEIKSIFNHFADFEIQWDGFEMPKTAAERKREERARKASRDGHDNVTDMSRDGHDNVTLEREREREEREIPPIAPQGGSEGHGGFSAFWAARPKISQPDSVRNAQAAYDSLIAQGAEPAELLQAMQGYALWAMDAQKHGRKHFPTTANWLRDGMFAQYVGQSSAETVDAGLDLPEWQQPLCQVLQAHIVRAFFRTADFDGQQITFRKKFDFDFVREKFTQEINRALGNVRLSLAGA